MNKQHVKGMADKAKGSARDMAGRASGNLFTTLARRHFFLPQIKGKCGQ